MTEAHPQGLFDAAYYRSHCGDIAYQRNQIWLEFFDHIAERIIADIQPKSVLDAGCAYGMLVERLRARGVEAWGVDISDYAIHQAAPEVQEFLWLGSITEPLPRSYDLIVSIEVVEHMPAPDSLRAIENLCHFSDDILISTTPHDYKEPTHFNVQPPDYWARQFARHSFFRDLDFDGSVISPWASRYRRQAGLSPEIIQSYERLLWRLQNEVGELRGSVVEQHQQLQMHEARWAQMDKGDIWKLAENIQALRKKLIPAGSQRERLLHKIFGK